MCQICQITELAAQQRWPKTVEASKADLDFLVNTIHDEFVQYQQSKNRSTDTPLPKSLLELCCTLSHQLDTLEIEREKWWTSPESRAKRLRFEQEGSQKNLSELHKIINNTSASFEALYARLGLFVK